MPSDKRIAPAAPDFYVGLRAVRGYTGNLRRLAEKCEEAGLTASPGRNVERIVTIDGRQPGHTRPSRTTSSILASAPIWPQSESCA